MSALWLMKSEPDVFSIDDLASKRTGGWDGVRNYEARNNLAAMKRGDLALYYHSNEGKEVVGVVEVVQEAYPDPTTDDERWVVVEIEPRVAFREPVTLGTIKADPRLSEIQLVRRGRLSVVPLTAGEFKHVLALGKTALPARKSKRA